MKIERGKLTRDDWLDLKRRYEAYLNPTGQTPNNRYTERHWEDQRRHYLKDTPLPVVVGY